MHVFAGKLAFLIDVTTHCSAQAVAFYLEEEAKSIISDKMNHLLPK